MPEIGVRVPISGNYQADANGMKLSSNALLLNELRASRGDRVVVSRMGSAFDGAG